MDSYAAYRIIMGFIGSTLAIVFGLCTFFTALRHGDFVWQSLIVAGLGALGELICYVMWKERSKKDTKASEEEGNDNEKN